VIEANLAACELFGRSRAQLIASAPAALYAGGRPLERQPVGTVFETQIRRADGCAIPVEVDERCAALDDTCLVVQTVRDVRARRAAAAALQRQSFRHGLLARFGQLALEGPPLDELDAEAMAIVRDGLGVELCRLLQATDDDLMLVQAAGFGWDDEWTRSLLFDAVAETQDRFALGARESIVVVDFDTELRFDPSPIQRAHGVRSAVEALICGACGSYGVLGAYAREPGAFDAASADFLKSIATTMAAAIERRVAGDRLAHMAQFDTLTGLPNRGLYLDRLSQTLIDAERDKRPVGVLFVDIDRFKCVNDTLGHAAGDLLLGKIAARLQATVRAGDTVGRLGGDEFTVTLSHLARAEDAGTVARKIVDALAEPYRLGEETVYVSASVGIGVYPADGHAADTLLKNADTAMYRAKESGRNGYEFFLPTMNERAVARMRLESDLRGALDRGEYRLHYQPKVNLATGEISGMEALLRWAPPGRDLVPPNDFIPVLEDTGLIVPVGQWVVETVCAQLCRWQAEGVPLRPVAINLSARQFRQTDLDAAIGEILSRYGVVPELLELELTESILMSDSETAVRVLSRIKARGIRLAVDDFGTGYSSLAYLKRFPIDALKIDRTFIRDVTTDADDATIARTIINLAHSLKLTVVAEGVETEEQLAFLRAHACDEMQGYLFARPLTVEQMGRALQEGRRLAPAALQPVA
jgi:diguanylate cyclase (GGDEF)-like protein